MNAIKFNKLIEERKSSFYTKSIKTYQCEKIILLILIYFTIFFFYSFGWHEYIDEKGRQGKKLNYELIEITIV